MGSIEDRDERPTQPLRLPPDLGSERSEPTSGATEQGQSEGHSTAGQDQDRPSGPVPEPESGDAGLALGDEIRLPSEPSGVKDRTKFADSIAPPLRDERVLSQDEIVTPMPLPISRPVSRVEPRAQKVPGFLWALVVLSLVVSLASLALNGLLIYRLTTLRQQAVEGVDAAIAALDGLAGDGLHFDYPLQQTIPFVGEVPFQGDILFPFKGEIPFNSTVEVSLGPFPPMAVPVDTSVPVDVVVPVHIDQVFPVSTTVPVSMTIPINIEPGDAAMRSLLGPIREWLVQLRESL